MHPLSAQDLTRALEGRDAETLLSFYTEDAVVRFIDRDHPPSRPLELRGRGQIARYYEDVCGRAMTHHVNAISADESHIAFLESCAYADGLKVSCSAMLTLSGGRIVEQTNVQAWDC